MHDTLSYMIERSRFDERRLLEAVDGSGQGLDPRLVDEVASALLACCYLQTHGTMFARAAAEKRAGSIGRALRQAGLEREAARRLRRMAQGLGGFFDLH